MIISSRFAKPFYFSMALLLAIIGAVAYLATPVVPSAGQVIVQVAIAYWLAAALNLVCVKYPDTSTLLHGLLFIFVTAMASSQTLLGDYQWWAWLPAVLYLLPFLGKLLARLPKTGKSGSELEGTIKWFNSKKGFGFIVTESNEEYFVHFKALKNGNRYQLKNGAAVRFELRATDRGQQAINVFIV